jgi:hypothetical protein
MRRKPTTKEDSESGDNQSRTKTDMARMAAKNDASSTTTGSYDEEEM